MRGDARSRKRRFWKIAFLIGGLSAALVAAACLFASYRIYAENKAVAWKFQFPKMASPRPPQRILIFAPHCDDETLGAAGLIRQARQHGCEVHVVLITNGDGFRVSAAQEMKEVVVSPKDYIQYAYRRQGETRTALRLLGLAPEQITFLGYPDQGLMPMWTTDWTPQTLFRSAFTQSDHCPYNNALTPHAAYCGASLLQDIRREISDDKPTDIFVTHPNDDHPDHAAAAMFVQTALEQIKAEGKPWAQGAQLHYYLVHHGDWPVPQGLHENEPMDPPASLASGDTDWLQLPLTRKDTQAKYAAIKCYPTQTRVSSRFLFSFARKNELFGTWNGVTTAHLPYREDSRTRWSGLKPVSLDPADETLAKTLTPSADIVRVFACRDLENLHLRLDTRGPISPNVDYIFTLRRVTPGGENVPAYTLSRPSYSEVSRSSPGQRPRHEHGYGMLYGSGNHFVGTSYSWEGSTLEVTDTLWGLQHPAAGTMLYLAVETRLHGVAVDATGFRGLLCTPPATHSTPPATHR